jgi:hypothetical protein
LTIVAVNNLSNLPRSRSKLHLTRRIGLEAKTACIVSSDEVASRAADREDGHLEHIRVPTLLLYAARDDAV